MIATCRIAGVFVVAMALIARSTHGFADDPTLPTKASVRAVYGDPLRTESEDGDDFWYYVFPAPRDVPRDLGHSLTGLRTWIYEPRVDPPPSSLWVVTFRFDGRTGQVKAYGMQKL